MRRALPAIGLFFLSPLVAEYLLGNLPITAIAALVLLAPLYGGGAVLIREVTRRAGRGWPTIRATQTRIFSTTATFRSWASPFPGRWGCSRCTPSGASASRSRWSRC
jgi:hypothetical protein